MGSHGALSLISGGWPKRPPPHLAENLKRRLDRVKPIQFNSTRSSNSSQYTPIQPTRYYLSGEKIHEMIS